MNAAHYPLLEIFHFLFRFQIVSFRFIVTMIIVKLLFPLSVAMLHLPTTSGHAIWQSPPAPYGFTPAAAELEAPAGDLCSSLLHNLEVLAQDNTFNCQPMPSDVKGTNFKTLNSLDAVSYFDHMSFFKGTSQNYVTKQPLRW